MKKSDPDLDGLTPEIERLFAAKEERRKRLAALPFPEKIKIIIEMQKMVAPILRARGIKVRVWGVQNEECRMKNAECRMKNAECRMSRRRIIPAKAGIQ